MNNKDAFGRHNDAVDVFTHPSIECWRNIRAGTDIPDK